MHASLITKRLQPTEIDQAISILVDGGILGVPTETVYGLAADATNDAAVRAIFDAKQRPQDNPLIVHVGSIEVAMQFVSIKQSWIWTCLERFSPGPISFVLPYTGGLASAVTSGLPTVAVRIPNHPTFLKLLKQSGLAVAAPSANRSGRPSATTWQAVLEDLDGRIDGVLCDTPCTFGLESTVVDATGDSPIILRAGAVSLEELQTVAPNATIAQRDSHLAKRSPGTRFRHYQPNAKVLLTDDFFATIGELDPTQCAVIGLSNHFDIMLPKSKMMKQCLSKEDYASSLFEFFRRADSDGCRYIVCHAVDDAGIGHAIMDRLRRASDSR